MTYGLLTPDVPLGPFEGSSVTVWSAQSKQARLHASPSCSALHSSQPVRQRVGLDPVTVGRMCTRCAEYRSWARPGTGLHLFLEAVTGLGLLSELDSYTQADQDSYGDDDVHQAAAALHERARVSRLITSAGQETEDDEEAEEALSDALHVRQTVLSEWRAALTSLHRAHQVVDLFPWLKTWAATRLTPKIDRLETLRTQAGRLVSQDAVVAVAAVSVMPEPDIHPEDPRLIPLGSPKDVAGQVTSLWRRWRSAVEDSCEHPYEQRDIAYYLAHGVSSRRTGSEALLQRARALLIEWEESALRQATNSGERTLVARFPRTTVSRRGAQESVLSKLTEWELAVLASCGITVDWAQSSLTLRVAEPVAVRLLSQRSVLSYEEQPTETTAATPEPGPRPGSKPLSPGVFDDTPVHARRLLTLEHVRLLRSTLLDPEQLYVVFSRDAGLEVTPLGVLEDRCASGWQGVVIAGASDLPDILFPAPEPKPPTAAAAVHDTADEWTGRVHDPEHPEFGRRLGIAEGERVFLRMCQGRRDGPLAQRSLALARGVTDLRVLESDGYDDRGHARRAFPAAVWHGLLATETPNLEPFAPASAEPWGGLGLPLGVLAEAQVYTSDGAGQYEGRAHAFHCVHRRHDRGVHRDDDMVTLAKLLISERFDPCTKCGGYAVRRLTDTQVAYYRAAHRLHNLSQRIGASARYHTRPVEELTKTVDELSPLDRQTSNAWFASPAEDRQWQRITHRLRAELQQSA
ncbi:hypothetical protein ACH4ZU_07625 [Streptomyces sp. NPDC020472]|uniref:hypothetical protein n=1 Tax=Streptomyces sp. NPDC020472 TaxID=3365075 RepID=UPI00378DD601